MWAALDAKLKGYKTILAARLYAAGGIVLAGWEVLRASGVDISPLIPPQYLPFVTIAGGIGFELLRRVTDSPVGEKE
jgi:hypothetical protein